MNEATQTDDRQQGMARREALASLGVGAAALAGMSGFAAGQSGSMQRSRQRGGASTQPDAPDSMLGWDRARGKYVLPPLPYAYGALEPGIDEQTMRLHHGKHHAGYVRGLNTALARMAAIRAGRRDASEVKHWSRQLAFNGSGHMLHVIFWNCMTPGGSRPSGMVSRMIDRDFGSYDGFAAHFKAASGSVEGSGWGILVYEPMSQQLQIMQAEKHQNLTTWGVVPLVAIDVWEHAYYLKYQNRRGAYVDAFMGLINWDFANRLLGWVTREG